MSLPSFSVRRPVTVAMVFLGIAVVGLVSFSKLSLDMFPKIEPPMISVITHWLGASATDVEEKVTKVIENRLSSTPDLDEMSSISMDNVSIVQLKFDWGTNLDEATNNIRSLTAFAKRLMPDEVDDSMIFRLNLAQMPILMFAVTTSKGDIQDHADFIEDNIINDLKRVDGVASVVSFNQRFKQLLVEVDRRRLEAYGLSLQQVAGMLKANNLTLPAGTMDVGRTSYTIRAPGEYETADDVKNVIIGQNKGSLIYLKDVAKVHIGLEDKLSEATMNGHPAMMLMVQRESGANTVDVARAVQQRIGELNNELPEQFNVATVMDMSDNIVHMIDSLSEAVYYGGALVILVVFLFLRRWRTSLIVALSIPTSLIGVFAMLVASGYTLNIITLAAMAIAIGMVVDDSIVVIDNIVRHVELGKDADSAASVGAGEVSNAVTAATLTTAAIFMPVLFVGGMIGIFFTELSFVVIVSIGMSLLVSLMLVPVLGRRLLRREASGEGKGRGRIARWGDHQMARLERAYGRVIGWALRNRKKVVVIALTAFGASLLITRVVGMDFMPKSDGGMLMINAELPIGTNVNHTYRVANRIQEIIKKRIPEAELTFVRAGASKTGMGSVMGGRQGSNMAMVMCRVPTRSLRDRTTFEMAEAIRPEVAAIPGLVTVEIDGSNPMAKLASGGQKPFTLEIFANSIGDLRQSAKQIKKILARTPGAVNTVTDLMDDNPELQLKIDRLDAARLGVPVASVAAAVRTSMYGSAVTRYRGGEEDIDLFLRLREQDRRTVADIRNLTVPSMSGAQIRLSTIARINEARSPIEVRRLDQQRTMRVMADISGRPLGDVAADVERAIEADKAAGKFPAGMSTRFGGDVREQRSMVVDLSLALLLAILLVYMVMASQFESMLDPFVVMFSVPFGITGTLLALPAAGVTLSITSFIGMIMLVGIVVKNAIVLVDYINLMRNKGMGLDEAIQRGGERRLRPVLMTACTTIGGMLPLAIASGEGSEMWKPMAVAVIGGLLVSTLVTLVLIPCVYALTDGWRRRGKQSLDREQPVHAAVADQVTPAQLIEEPAGKYSETLSET